MFAAALGPALLQAAALLACPESPVWLLRAGRTAQAALELRRLHGPSFRPQDYPALAAGSLPGSPFESDSVATTAQPLLPPEQGLHRDGTADQSGEALGWAALWAPRYRRAMVLAASIPVLQQLSGINSIVFFSTDVSALKQL
jgi:hypothetical protein